jgi:hypothetical protein
MKEVRSQAISTGMQFERLGHSFQEGVKIVGDLVEGLDQVKIDPSILSIGTKMSAVLGLSGKEVGEFAKQFQAVGAGSKEMNQALGSAELYAKKFNIPIHSVMRDMAQAPDLLSRFGVKNRVEFGKSTAVARLYGTSIKDINAAFGEQLDSFEGSATAAAKLNSAFGTNINSMKLMLETNPVKRMEMIRKELLGQGKAYEKLNPFEQNAIKAATGLDGAQAALYFSSQKRVNQLKAEENQKKKMADVDMKWNESLSTIKSTLISWQPLLEQLGLSITNFIAKLFGFSSADKPIGDFAHNIEKFMTDMTSSINKAGDNIGKFKDKFDSIVSPIDNSRAQDAIDLMDKQNKTLDEQLTLKKLLNKEGVLGAVQMKEQNKFGLSEEDAKKKIALAKTLSDIGGSADEKFDKLGSGERNMPSVQAKFQKLQQELNDRMNSKVEIKAPKTETVNTATKSKVSKEQKEKQEKETKKMMKDAHKEALAEHASNDKEVIIRLIDADGNYFARGIMDKARGV